VDETFEAVLDLACRLKKVSISNRYRIEDNWPLTSPKHFTSIALIHHKKQQTRREVLAVATLQKRGSFDLNKIHSEDEYFKQSKCTKDISEIFSQVECPDGTNKYPDIILIEGVPGIGKTVLSREIVFQWAKGKLLPDKILVFLIYLRDTESQKINSFESFVNYVSYPEVAKHIMKYITKNKGKDIMIVFDGYDELSEKNRNNSFLYKMVTQTILEMPYCSVVITSRPNVSTHLHDKVDRRVEILGFTNEDRKAYIVDTLNGDNSKIEKMMKYLNNNPAIDAYCYIPLNMAILLSFFDSGDITKVTDLPNTQTGINEKFICTTISRYIGGLKYRFSKFSEVRAPCDDHKQGTPCIGHDKGVPYGRILREISKLAFKALEKDEIVFTPTDLQEACPCLTSCSENLNGLGLLKAVQFFNFDTLGNFSFNFLHYTIQEILAAYHITLMPKNDQLKSMQNTFWNSRYYNTWIMYVGLTKNQAPITFKHFLSGNWFLPLTRFYDWWKSGTYFYITNKIMNDKIKCLYLFQCFLEAGNNDLCQYVGHLLQEKKIDLSNQTLSPRNLHTLSFFLTRSTTKDWHILNLSKCFIGDNGIEQLHKSFTSNNRSKICINTLNLSHNNLTHSSFEFIASLILEWNVKNLTVLFDDINWHGLNEEIMCQIMQLKIQGDALIICKINENVTFFARLSESEYFIFSCNSISEQALCRIKAIFTKPQAYALKLADIKSIICTLHNYTTVSYLNLGTIQFEINDIVIITKNNELIESLCLPKIENSIFSENIELEKIFDALKSKTSLKYVNMKLLTVDSDLVKSVAALMVNNKNFQEIKLSKLLLGCNDFHHLKSHLVKITLRSLSITDYIFTREDSVKLVAAIECNSKIQELNLSNCIIHKDQLLSILSYTFKLTWLNLSNCLLCSKTIKKILGILKQMEYLLHVNLSANFMTSDAVNEMAAMIRNNKYIKAVFLPDCFLNQNDLRLIIQAMQTISSLEYVDFSTNEFNNELSSDIAVLFANNSKLEQLNVHKLALKQDGFQNLKSYLLIFKGLKHLNTTDCTFTYEDAVYLGTLIGRNFNIQELIISDCEIIDNRAIAMTDGTGTCDQLENLKLSNNIVIKMIDQKVMFTTNNTGIYDQLENLSSNIVINPLIHKLLIFISHNSNLKGIVLRNCQLRSYKIRQILMVLKYKSYLQFVDLSGNTMMDNSVSDVEAMIINNKQLKKLCLPNSVRIQQARLEIIIQAMQAVPSLKYLNFS